MGFYKRKLPHWQPEGGEYFITIRLKGSLPRSAIEKMKDLRKQLNDSNPEPRVDLKTYIQREIFKTYEEFLDGAAKSPTWLSREKVAKLVQDSILYRDSKFFDLYAYCIMPNHLHLVFRHLIQDKKKEYPITDILRNFKRYTARKCNKILNRSGAFGQAESYDRVIRDQKELENTIRYTLNNPVKAGLAQQWEEWPYSYCRPNLVETFRTI